MSGDLTTASIIGLVVSQIALLGCLWIVARRLNALSIDLEHRAARAARAAVEPIIEPTPHIAFDMDHQGRVCSIHSLRDGIDLRQVSPVERAAIGRMLLETNCPDRPAVAQ